LEEAAGRSTTPKEPKVIWQKEIFNAINDNDLLRGCADFFKIKKRIVE